MLRLTPKAKPSWRPTNHCPRVVVMATIIDSAPRAEDQPAHPPSPRNRRRAP